MGGIKKIRGNMDPSPNDRVVGQLPNGDIIYEVEMPQSKKVQAMDPNTGKPAFKVNPHTNQVIGAVMKRVPLEPLKRRFTMHDLGNGTVVRNFNFEDTAPKVPTVHDELAELRAELETLKQTPPKQADTPRPRGRPKGSRNKPKTVAAGFELEE
jgi:hypothetical protein